MYRNVIFKMTFLTNSIFIACNQIVEFGAQSHLVIILKYCFSALYEGAHGSCKLGILPTPLFTHNLASLFTFSKGKMI